MSDINDLFPLPLGPGSQPPEEDGAQLAILQLPSGMMTFSTPQIPEPTEASLLTAGKNVGWEILALLHRYVASVGQVGVAELSHLGAEDFEFVRQLLGEGEVSVVCGNRFQAQESVLAGVWLVRETEPDGSTRTYVEIGSFPAEILAHAFPNAALRVEMPATLGSNLFNAPPLLAEINEQTTRVEEGLIEQHVINLSLLPHTEEDLIFLDERLGEGELIILSRGYGNCRIRSTGTRNCWWVRHYNSQDTLILNCLEISLIPNVALAAPEDLADSAERLAEIMDLYK